MRDATLGPDFDSLRERMVRLQLEARGLSDPRVLEVMRRLPRHLFVPEALRGSAYEDRPLPIGFGQTISQPYIVALMTQLLQAAPSQRVLDVGTGSGYQAALLGRLVAEVIGIERIPELADRARRNLAAAGGRNVGVRCGDGHAGCPDVAPFDAIVLACAPVEVPAALLDQLAPGGRLVAPIGKGFRQRLVVIEKQPDGGTRCSEEAEVAFVPMLAAPPS